VWSGRRLILYLSGFSQQLESSQLPFLAHEPKVEVPGSSTFHFNSSHGEVRVLRRRFPKQGNRCSLESAAMNSAREDVEDDDGKEPCYGAEGFG
jgi:hypothetical protein